MSAFSLSAVVGLGWESGVALSANHFVALIFSSDGGKTWFNLDGSHSTSSESEHEMKSGLLLNVVVGESSSIF